MVGEGGFQSRRGLGDLEDLDEVGVAVAPCCARRCQATERVKGGWSTWEVFQSRRGLGDFEDSPRAPCGAAALGVARRAERHRPAAHDRCRSLLAQEIAVILWLKRDEGIPGRFTGAARTPPACTPSASSSNRRRGRTPARAGRCAALRLDGAHRDHGLTGERRNGTLVLAKT